MNATNRVIETVYQPEARQRGEHPSDYARLYRLKTSGPVFL
ncbi:hypothetical protein ACFFOP_15730 [Sinosporangium siamense]